LNFSFYFLLVANDSFYNDDHIDEGEQNDTQDLINTTKNDSTGKKYSVRLNVTRNILILKL
jgi:hypothetical protein